ncbi:MAG: hypothetical protein QHH75_14620 [Bacillota bacterium]|nr:hypothetical protein [Bacillota bacterium]
MVYYSKEGEARSSFGGCSTHGPANRPIVNNTKDWQREVQKMGVLEVFSDEIKEYKRLKIISEMVLVKEHIKLFEQKYGCAFQDFEKKVKQEAEDFGQWDDYIEWKAYQKSFEGLKKKIGEIEHAKDVRIAE